VSVVGLKSLDVSPCNELLLLPVIIKTSLHTPARKSTFGVHYRKRVTGSTGSPGRRIPGSLDRSLTKCCDPIPCLLLTDKTDICLAGAFCMFIVPPAVRHCGIARSVHLSVPWRSCLGYRRTGCLQLAGHQRCADCGRVRGRT